MGVAWRRGFGVMKIDYRYWVSMVLEFLAKIFANRSKTAKSVEKVRGIEKKSEEMLGKVEKSVEKRKNEEKKRVEGMGIDEKLEYLRKKLRNEK